MLFRLILSVGRLRGRVNEGICESGNVERMDDVGSRIRSKSRMYCESLQRRACFGDIGVNYDINMVTKSVFACGLNCIAQYRIYRQAFVNTARNFQVILKTSNFLSTWELLLFQQGLCLLMKLNYYMYHIIFVGRDSSVGLAINYGLDGPGIESRSGQDFPHPSRPALGPTQPSIQWVPGLSPEIKRPGRDVDHWPPSSAEVKERVELDLYSSSGPSYVF